MLPTWRYLRLSVPCPLLPLKIVVLSVVAFDCSCYRRLAPCHVSPLPSTLTLTIDISSISLTLVAAGATSYINFVEGVGRDAARSVFGIGSVSPIGRLELYSEPFICRS